MSKPAWAGVECKPQRGWRIATKVSRSGVVPMKRHVVLAAALLAGAYLVWGAADANAFHHRHRGCCAPACCEPTCGCEPTCCDPCCQPCRKHCGLFGWLHHCKKRCCGCCEVSCGCEPACGCAAEPACGCAVEPACGCEPSCGCEPCCQPRCRKHCGLFGWLHRCCKPRCHSCCNDCCYEASCGCEPVCGCN